MQLSVLFNLRSVEGLGFASWLYVRPINVGSDEQLGDMPFNFLPTGLFPTPTYICIYTELKSRRASL